MSTDCAEMCVKIFDPKCGTDGRIYGNQCELEKAACKNPSLQLEIDPDNRCQGGKHCTVI